MDENEELKANNERLKNQVADYQAYIEQLENTHTTEHVNDRFTALLNKLLSAIENEKHDEEMAFRSLIKSQFKLHDAKLEAKLFNLLIKKSSSNTTTTSDCVDLSTVEPLTY